MICSDEQFSLWSLLNCQCCCPWPWGSSSWPWHWLWWSSSWPWLWGEVLRLGLQVESLALKVKLLTLTLALRVKYLLTTLLTVQALKHVKSMKLVEGSYAAKEMALDKINALISIVEQSESQKEVSHLWASYSRSVARWFSPMTTHAVQLKMMMIKDIADEYNNEARKRIIRLHRDYF